MFRCFILLTAILLSIESINATPADTSRQTIKAVEVRDSGFLFGESLYRVYYVGALVVYQSQNLSESFIQRSLYDSASRQEAFVSEQEESQWRSRFFVYHRDSSHGISYDPYNTMEYNRRLPVDSILQMIKGTNTYENLNAAKPDTATWNTGRTELKEVYVSKGSQDTPTVRLVFYYSSRLNHVQEALSKALDSVRKMKLVKIEICIEEFLREKDKRLWPQMTQSTEMKEIHGAAPEEVMHYVEQYQSKGSG